MVQTNRSSTVAGTLVSAVVFHASPLRSSIHAERAGCRSPTLLGVSVTMASLVGAGRPGDALHIRCDVGADGTADRGSGRVERDQVEANSVGIVVDEVGIVFVGVFLLFGCGLRVFGEDGEPAAVGGDVEVFDIEG